jgi:hypothetical protein
VRCRGARQGLSPGQPKNEEAVRRSVPDELDQTLHFDPAEPELMPEDDVDQS